MSGTVLSRQSLLDVAVQHAGTAEAVFEFAAANGISVTDELAAGEELITVEAVDRGVFEYYKNNGLKPATGLTAADGGSGDGFLEEGIEFWYVEYDFEVV